MQPKNLFYLLYNATTEGEVEKLVKKNPVFQKKENWKKQTTRKLQKNAFFQFSTFKRNSKKLEKTPRLFFQSN